MKRAYKQKENWISTMLIDWETITCEDAAKPKQLGSPSVFVYGSAAGLQQPHCTCTKVRT